MILWSDYLADMRMYLPECPDVVMRGAVRDTAARFCEATLCWQDTLDFVVSPSERDVRITTDDDDILIVRLLKLGREDYDDIWARTPGWLDRQVWNWRYISGCPQHYTMPVRNEIIWLIPHTDAVITLNATVALKPGPDSIEGPDDLYQNYREGVQAGAIAMLAAVPNKPWTSKDQFAIHGAVYNQVRDSALVAVSRGNTRAPIRVVSNHRF